ncbi:carboxypeptidase regulatory-like domain-containing protein [Hymenobacter gummosus]|uniref:Carboxypeptidase regulatory-like domain-containing protein n=1 Tax=Hymenobacter gummosus TaxID=1776032 RepID=A0A431U747_9BACT|nr:carboxypeptidase-like regulatory domain-containing protein [Hymenobacter gummosus]RTQ52282.1 carboxypeptidase regulatory-like domain-containing protein [Hymenobacter gummosus]
MFLSLLNRVLLGAGLMAASASQPATAHLAENPVAGSSVNITGSFTGVLLDQYTGRPLSQATVALMRQDNAQLVAGALTADNGEFRLDRARFGRYVLHIEVAGYQPIREEITLAAGRDVIDLGAYGMIPSQAAQRTATTMALATRP